MNMELFLSCFAAILSAILTIYVIRFLNNVFLVLGERIKQRFVQHFKQRKER